MTATTTQDASEQASPVIGLALSGGGFRAAAFRLGVLKRLRELGLLSRIQIISTVSGGSIIGALWVCCQARWGDTLADEIEWSKFERFLVSAMSTRPSIRGIVFSIGFVCPLVLSAIVTAFLVWWIWPIGVLPAICLILGDLALAYMCWHYGSTTLLEKCYDRLFYRSLQLSRLDPERLTRHCPFLMINATGLNNGELVIFPTRQFDVSPWALHDSVLHKVATRYATDKDITVLPMSADSPVARAVAASSAIPGVFVPLKLRGALNRVVGPLRGQIWGESGRQDSFRAVDGGVVDNQGTYVLASLCQHLIISDGAAALKEHVHPSTWQLWPPGRGVIARAQDIIFHRVRHMGYKRLQDWLGLYRRLHRKLADHGLEKEKIESITEDLGMTLKSYSYVELETADTFPWPSEKKQSLPTELMRFVSRIRTDLDCFSLVEISALMFHGYTMIDHCVTAYQPGLLSESVPPLRFSFPAQGLFRDWDNPTQEEIDRAAKHLSVSGSRFGMWRSVYRFLKNR